TGGLVELEEVQRVMVVRDLQLAVAALRPAEHRGLHAGARGRLRLDDQRGPERRALAAAQALSRPVVREEIQRAAVRARARCGEVSEQTGECEHCGGLPGPSLEVNCFQHCHLLELSVSTARAPCRIQREMTRAPRPCVAKLNAQRTSTTRRFWKPIRYARCTPSQSAHARKPLRRSGPSSPTARSRPMVARLPLSW